MSKSFSLLVRHFQSGSACRIELNHGRYSSIQFEPDLDPTPFPWIAPGLFDPQINGFGGYDFNRHPGTTDLHNADTALAAHGCTHYLLTVITRPRGEYGPLLQQWESQRGDLGLAGYHLEGPFLNPDPGYRGVHPTENMLPASLDFLDEVLEASHQSVRLITLAPEIESDKALEFIRAATGRGVRVAAGHSAAMGEILERSRHAGLSGWTHLGNAAPASCHKFENVLWHALASGLPYISLIPDGIHLPPHLFRALARALGERLILTTDAMAGAGAAAGRWTLGQAEVDVTAQGRATVAGTDKLAGSTLTPFAGVFLASSMGGIPWPECWTAFSTRPATWLGIDHDLKPGNEATFCLFDTHPAPRLRETWRRGQQIFRAPSLDSGNVPDKPQKTQTSP